MKMTKYMLTAFAVFASVLMLMTPTMARPVAEKTTMDVVETTEQELAESLERLSIKLSRDTRVNSLINSITRDPAVARSVTQLEQAVTEEEMSMAFEQLVVSIEGKTELTQLENIMEQGYAAEAEAINEQLEIIVNDGDGDVQSMGTILDLIILVILSCIVEILIGMVIQLLCMVLIGILWLLHELFGWFDDIFGDGDGGTPSF